MGLFFWVFLLGQKLQDMEEKRIERIGACMKAFADVDRQVIPIVGKCLDGMTKAAEAIQPTTVSGNANKPPAPVSSKAGRSRCSGPRLLRLLPYSPLALIAPAVKRRQTAGPRPRGGLSADPPMSRRMAGNRRRRVKIHFDG